ncbi:hypothetical protein JG687_00010838 [Phytophthora cactorum]|uniref:Uncharacterized protein n=1 Tax=Phytophthora cactorum TaxID=29920 RepID=A0A8T1U5T6_9STRA|nr:hypothetical protein JG687_00010838 [Phytophthora cactorum]
MYADVQVIDMNMCDTVKDMYVDLVYSGVVASTNGNKLIFSLPCVGQFFLDKDLISSVEAVTLYSTNKQSTKVNSRDNVFKEASGNGYDPNFQYSLVGDTVEDGVFVWISVAVDMTAERGCYSGIDANWELGYGYHRRHQHCTQCYHVWWVCCSTGRIHADDLCDPLELVGWSLTLDTATES